MLLTTIAVSLASAVVGATLGRSLESLDESLWDGGLDPDADMPAREDALVRSAV
jgi:hypothetical protein